MYRSEMTFLTNSSFNFISIIYHIRLIDRSTGFQPRLSVLYFFVFVFCLFWGVGVVLPYIWFSVLCFVDRCMSFYSLRHCVAFTDLAS